MKITDGLKWYDIKIFFKRLVFVLRHGYLPQAQWETFNWFIYSMREILTFYRNERTGDPWVLELEEPFNEGLEEANAQQVNKDFDNMLMYLDLMDETNPIYEDMSMNAEYNSKEKAKEKFFKLFSKYFYNLWD